MNDANDVNNQIAKRVIARRAERCKHFNGIQNESCEAGVLYSNLDAAKLPCLPAHLPPTVLCDKFETFTPEEIARQERDMSEHFERIARVMESIKPLREDVRRTKQSVARKMDCAGCGGKETLFVGIAAYNGHARGQCTACDIRWIE